MTFAMAFGLIKGGLLVGAIVDIALQVDKNFLFHEEEASFGSIGGLNVSLTTICLIALYAIWLMEAAQSKARPKTLPMLGLPAVLYLLAIGLSMFAAQNRLLSLFELNLLIQEERSGDIALFGTKFGIPQRTGGIRKSPAAKVQCPGAKN